MYKSKTKLIIKYHVCIFNKFTEFKKSAVHVVMSVHPHGTQLTLDSFYAIWYLSIFPKSVKKFKFPENLTGMTDTLHEDLCTFVILSRLVLLRLRNVSK